MRRRSIPGWVRVVPTVFVLAWGGNHFTPLLHLYEAHGFAAWQANLLLGMYVVGLVPGLLVAGALSDRSGRKAPMVAGLAAAALASVLIGAGFPSFALLCAGRVLAGVAVGIAMSVGSSWIKELSASPWDPLATATAGARRSSLTLTLGFAIGALVTGVLGQWGPWPERTPFVVHLVLCVLALPALLSAPETSTPANRAGSPWWRDLRVPSAGHAAFRRIVLPIAPWVFAAAGVAYAVLPAAVDRRLGDDATLYATILTVLTLGSAAVVQGFVPRLDRWSGRRAIVLGMGAMVLGLALAAVSAALASPVLVLVSAAVLGAAFGVCMVAGLLIVQAIATPRDLAGMIGRYYSLCYLGFLLPTVLAALTPWVPYPLALLGVTVIAAGCLAAVVAGRRRV